MNNGNLTYKSFYLSEKPVLVKFIYLDNECVNLGGYYDKNLHISSNFGIIVLKC